MPDEPKKPITEKVKERAAHMAEDVRSKATDKARSEAEDLRDTAAHKTQKAADAAESAAAEFETGSMQAQAIEQVASRVEEIAAQIRGSDIDRLARTVRQTAERNPLMFFAGAALAGFAVTRFLKARDPNASSQPGYEDDPWADDTYSRSAYGASPDLTSRGSV
jgi:hypothetical protein